MKTDSKSRTWQVPTSIAILLVCGNLLAHALKSQPNSAWYYVAAFYWGWMILSVGAILPFRTLRDFFRKPKKHLWILLPLIFIIPAFIMVFLPHAGLLKWNWMLLATVVVILINPVIEEIYWRGMISRTFENRWELSFILSVGGFALSHPLIFGINSVSLSGASGFIGTLVTGTIWWICFRKTGSLWGNVATHALANIAGMTVFVLNNSIVM